MSASFRAVLFWVVALLAVLVLYNFFKNSAHPQEELNYTQFIRKVEEGAVAKVTITGEKSLAIEGEYRERGENGAGKYFRTQALNDEKLVGLLRSAGVDMTFKEAKESTYLLTLMTWAPMLLIIGIWIFFMRQMQTGGNKALSFGKSKAKLSSSQGKKWSEMTA